jgi:hypothetical protein
MFEFATFSHPFLDALLCLCWTWRILIECHAFATAVTARLTLKNVICGPTACTRELVSLAAMSRKKRPPTIEVCQGDQGERGLLCELSGDATATCDHACSWSEGQCLDAQS